MDTSLEIIKRLRAVDNFKPTPKPVAPKSNCPGCRVRRVKVR